MRLNPLLVPALLAGLTLSCGEAPTGISEDSVLGLDDGIQLSTVVSAKNYHAAEVEWRPFAFDIQGCDEEVYVEGFSHNLGKSQVRGKKGPVTTLKVSAQGFGVGLTSGAKYVFSDKITYSTAGDIEGGQVVGASRQFKLVGQGSVENLYFFGVVSIAFYDDGDVSIDLDQAHQVCK